MRTLICGGRDFHDVEYAVDQLYRIDQICEFSLIISGGARGADHLGEEYARASLIPLVVCKAEWKKFGNRAGILRNQRMLDEQKPDLVIALPGGTGTAHMVGIARAAHVEVVEFRYIKFKKEDPQWGFLSNFYPSPIVDEDGCVWSTSEHFYQSRKTFDERARSRIQKAATPAEARALGRNATKTIKRPDWESVKDQVMREALELKFAKSSWMAEQLLSSGHDYLLEFSSWDSYWGSGKDGTGRNQLGKLLMERRNELLLDT